MGRKSAEKYPGQRSKEKRAFWGRYWFRVIEYLYKERFFALFGHRCFRCGAPEPPKTGLYYPMVLCMDHHLPMALGGHLQAGNLVALCRRCNGQKLDKHPDVFYTSDELERLQPLLNAQTALFSFAFDPDKWKENREAYLLDVGVSPAIVQVALNDELFEGYIEPASERSLGITIGVDIDIESLLANLQEIKNKDPP